LRLGLSCLLCGLAVVGECHVFFGKADEAHEQLVQPAASRQTGMFDAVANRV